MSLSLSVLRPLIGYGPELFRATFLLESAPMGEQVIVQTPHQAHNYFIHQGVELGLLGMITSLGIFGIVFLAGAYLLLRESQSYSNIHKLMLIGLLATLTGRFVEQMVGVPKVSDTTIFWVLLGIFVSLPTVMRLSQATAEVPLPQVSRRRRNHPLRRSDPELANYDAHFFWRLIVVLFLIGTVVTVTWAKGLNYVRAAVEARTADQAVRHDDFQSSLGHLSRAIGLAPDVEVYYNHHGRVYHAYQDEEREAQELSCRPREDYDICLAQKAYASHTQAAQQHPFSVYERALLAYSAQRLALLTGDPNLTSESIRLYQEAIAMVPHSLHARKDLAAAYLSFGQPEAALPVLKESLVITGETAYSVETIMLRGTIYNDLGQPERAIEEFNEAIRLDPEFAPAYTNRGATYKQLGQPERAIEDYNDAIRINPQDTFAYNNRAVTYTQLGQFERAIEDYNEAIHINPQFGEAYYNKGIAHYNLALLEQAIEDFDEAIRINPQYSQAYYRRGYTYDDLAKRERAIHDFDEAIRLDPEYSEAYYNRGVVYFNLGQTEKAVDDFGEAIRLNPQHSGAYQNRALLLTLLGNDQQARQDVDQIIKLGIDPGPLETEMEKLKSRR